MPAQAAAAWWAARQKVAVDKVQALGQRKVSGSEVQVLVMAERRGADAQPLRDRPQGRGRLEGAVNRRRSAPRPESCWWRCWPWPC